MAHQFRQSFGGELVPRTDGRFIERRPSLPDWFHSPNLTLARLCVLFLEQAKAAISAILRASPCAACSSMKDRRRLIAEEDAKIAGIVPAHEQLVDETAALEPPVILALLPEVKARGDTAAAKAQRERMEREAREKSEAAVNAAIPIRAAPSPYMARENARASNGKTQNRPVALTTRPGERTGATADEKSTTGASHVPSSRSL
jgi:hypothetical protein